MHALYTKGPRLLPSPLALAGALLLSACSDPPEAPRLSPEPWSDEAEATFQHAEVLRYSVEQQRLERERLHRLGLARYFTGRTTLEAQETE